MAITGKERVEIHRGDGINDEPSEVVLRQPLAQTRRQQQLLLAITRDEILGHPKIVLNPPDRPLCNSLHAKRERPPFVGSLRFKPDSGSPLA